MIVFLIFDPLLTADDAIQVSCVFDGSMHALLEMAENVFNSKVNEPYCGCFMCVIIVIETRAV